MRQIAHADTHASNEKVCIYILHVPVGNSNYGFDFGGCKQNTVLYVVAAVPCTGSSIMVQHLTS